MDHVKQGGWGGWASCGYVPGGRRGGSGGGGRRGAMWFGEGGWGVAERVVVGRVWIWYLIESPRLPETYS